MARVRMPTVIDYNWSLREQDYSSRGGLSGSAKFKPSNEPSATPRRWSSPTVLALTVESGIPQKWYCGGVDDEG